MPRPSRKKTQQSGVNLDQGRSDALVRELLRTSLCLNHPLVRDVHGDPVCDAYVKDARMMASHVEGREWLSGNDAKQIGDKITEIYHLLKHPDVKHLPVVLVRDVPTAPDVVADQLSRAARWLY